MRLKHQFQSSSIHQRHKVIFYTLIRFYFENFEDNFLNHLYLLFYSMMNKEYDHFYKNLQYFHLQ